MLVNSHVQTTAQFWPNTKQLKDFLSIPLSLSLQPFANFHPQSSITADKINQYRCQSCNAFLNQLCCIRSDYEYDCSLCGCTNRMSEPIDITIPQLNNMSYQLRASPKQRSLMTDQRLIVFVLDLSFYGRDSQQYILYVVQVIREFVIKVSQSKFPISCMLVGFDSVLHRFIINPGLTNNCSRIISNEEILQEEDQQQASYQQLIGNIQSCRQNIEQILNCLERDARKSQFKDGRSFAILQAIKFSLRASRGYSGQILIVSGLREQVKQFRQSLNKQVYSASQRHNFLINKKQCIKDQLQNLITETQMSLYFSFINQNFINLMPFLYMSNTTNGELRHYFPNQMIQFFYRFKEEVQVMMQQGTAYQSVLRVRYSKGVKLSNIFGAYRATKIADQIQMLCCPETRRYFFEFTMEGNISEQFILIQFSSIFTDIKGGRYIIVETYMNNITIDPLEIIPTIDYANINTFYATAAVRTLDVIDSGLTLQSNLLQLCKKHIIAILEWSIRLKLSEKSQDFIQQSFFIKARPYVILTYLLTKHFMLNTNYSSLIHYDLNTQGRSKMVTLEDSLQIIWPLTYAISKSGYQITQINKNNVSNNSVAILIDCCDQYYVHLTDPQFKKKLQVQNSKNIMLDLIQSQDSLMKLKQLIEQIKNRKEVSYLSIFPFQNLNQMRLFDGQGKDNYDNFITKLFRA